MSVAEVVYADYQQRVIEEMEELRKKLNKLELFIANNAIFPTLPADEQERLTRQGRIMDMYLEVLTQRIENFRS
jgi:hypothetical protein